MEFIPYTQALELKELGFNEPCWAWYNIPDEDVRYCYSEGRSPITNIQEEWDAKIDNRPIENIGLPTFSQAFNFLLEKYNLYAVIVPTVTTHWTFKTMTIANGMIDIPPYKNVDGNDYSSFKETEVACLGELIKIIKNKI